MSAESCSTTGLPGEFMQNVTPTPEMEKKGVNHRPTARCETILANDATLTFPRPQAEAARGETSFSIAKVCL